MLATSSNFSELSRPMTANSVHDIHEGYMEQLENQYTDAQLLKKAKRI